MFSKFFPDSGQKKGHSNVFNSDSRVIGFGPGLMLREEVFPAGVVLPVHDHYHEQISYVASGSMRCILADGSEMVLKEGECAYFAPYEKHSLVFLEDTAVIDAFTPIRLDHLEQKVFYAPDEK